MKDSPKHDEVPADPEWRCWVRRFALASGLLLALASPLLVVWARFANGDSLASYVLIIPLIAGFLAWRDRSELEKRRVPAPRTAWLLGAVALVLFGCSLWAWKTQSRPEEGALSLGILALVAAWNAVAFGTLGRRFMAGLAFPAAFLVFMAPLPPTVVDLVESGLQHASAEVAAWLFPLVGVPFFRTGLWFQLPTITLEVAPECSGIRSTLVLFITSLVAGHLVLEKTWQKAAFAALVVPLGIARNAFRIAVIGWLCTKHGPEMIDSPIHHRGGPVFFALSLLPLFALLFVFRRANRLRIQHGEDEGST